MKKLLVVLGVLLVSLLGILIAVPILFKEDAKKAVDDAIAEQVNAHVFYDQEGFSLSLFENFPNFEQNETRIAVFGNTTVKAATDSGLRVDIQAPTPETPSMTMALEKYIKEVNNKK